MRNAKLKPSACLPLAALTVLVMSLPAMSQTAVPMMINYQGLLSDRDTGEPIEGTCDLVFKIYNHPTDTDPTALLWEETHAGVKVADGVFSVILGSASALSEAHFSRPDRWLETVVEGETLAPRQRLTSVPYSIVSENSRLLQGNAASAFAEAVHTHSGSDITLGTVAESRIDPAIARDAEIMPTVLAADGAGSTLDADRLDGKDSTDFAPARHDHSGEDITSGTVPEPRIDASIARDAEVDSKIASHSGSSSAHHPKTTSFTELTDTALEDQIPPTIARSEQIMPTVLANDGPGSALNADVLDGVDSTGFTETMRADRTGYYRIVGQ